MNNSTPLIRMMIVGAPKCGTTSLKHYLAQHPQLLGHPQRELIYFANDAEYERGYAHALDVHYGSGATGDRLLIGKSVAMMYRRIALERLREHNPDVQIVVLLREPVARAYSEYWYSRRRGHEAAASFEAALAAPGREDASRPDAYIARSRYAEHISMLYDLFPATQVNVVLLEQLAREPVATCQALFRKMGIDSGFVPATTGRENTAAAVRSGWLLEVLKDRTRLSLLRRLLGPLLHTRTKRAVKALLQRLNDREFEPPPIADATRCRLLAYFEPWNARLQRLTGVPIDEYWSGRPGPRQS